MHNRVSKRRGLHQLWEHTVKCTSQNCSYPFVIWTSILRLQSAKSTEICRKCFHSPDFLSHFSSLPNCPRKVTATVKAMKIPLFSFALFKPEQLLEFIFCFPYFSSYAFKFKLTNAFVYNFKPSPSLMHQYLVTLPLISLFAMLLSAAWNCQGTKQPNFSLISQKIDSFMNSLFTYAP